MCIEYNECHYGGMHNVYVKRIFVITEIVHMNAGVSSESRERKRLKSLSHSHEAWHPRSTSTSGAGSGASLYYTLYLVFFFQFGNFLIIVEPQYAMVVP